MIRDFFSRFKSSTKRAMSKISYWPYTIRRSPIDANIHNYQDKAVGGSAVFCCMRIISETIASLPLHLYVQDTENRKSQAKKHPLYKVLHTQPNRLQTSFEFREWMSNSMIMYGNAYASIEWDENERVRSLYPLESHRVTPKWSDSGKELLYEEIKANGDRKTYREWEILHLKGPLREGILGASILDDNKRTINLTTAQDLYASRYFENSGTPSGIIEYDGELEQASVDNLRSTWRSLYGGENAHAVAVLEYGMQFKPLGINPRDSQLIESRQFQLSEVARIFRMPPHMIGMLDRSIKANIVQQSIEFIQYTMMPWFCRFEQAIQKDCLNIRDKERFYAKFNVDALMRGDPESRANFYKNMVLGGMFSPNEARELEDRDPIGPEGDKHYMPVNMATLEAISSGMTTPNQESTQPDNGDDQDEDQNGEEEDGE